MDFHVEIYELETGKRFSGDDTRTVVTILDEDFPGTLGFETVNVETSKHQERVEVKITRTNGADGEISCIVKTQPFCEGNIESNAIEYEDFLPMTEKLTFEHGETEKIVSVMLMNEKMPQIDSKQLANIEGDLSHDELNEVVDIMFKIVIQDP